jgi:Uma2 family endonuclease
MYPGSYEGPVTPARPRPLPDPHAGDVAARSSPPETPPPGEVRLLLHGVSWKDYRVARDALESPGLRMTFCEGELELMSRARPHEEWKKNIARMVEVFALDRDIPLYGYGSTTFKSEANKRGVEPDECYCVGGAMREWPEVVVEVVHTSPFAIDRRSVYEGLGAPELWIFEKGAFSIWRHDGAEYVSSDRSALLPALDFVLLARCCVRTDQHEALKEWWDAFRAKTT